MTPMFGQNQPLPGRPYLEERKNSSGFLYRFANSFSSTTSTRLSPDSIFETNDWGRLSLLATST